MQPKCSSLKSNRFAVNPKLTVFKQTTKRLIHPTKKKQESLWRNSWWTKSAFFNDDDDVVSVRTLKRKKDEAKSDPTVDSFFVGSLSLFLKLTVFVLFFYCIVLIASLLNSNLHTSLHHYRVVRLWSSQHSLSQSHKLSIISEILE